MWSVYPVPKPTPLFQPSISCLSLPSRRLNPSRSQRARKPSHTLHKDPPPGARAEKKGWRGDREGPTAYFSHSSQLHWALSSSSRPALPLPRRPRQVSLSCFSSLHFHKWRTYEAHLSVTSSTKSPSALPRSDLWILKAPLLEIFITTYGPA